MSRVHVESRFYINSSKKSGNTSTNNTSTNNSYIGKWNVWVPGSFTGPNDYGSHGYVGGASGGYIDIKSNGTFVWDMKTAVYQGTWSNHPSNPNNLVLKSSDGWDYTLTRVDAKTIKWYSYGLEYYGIK